MNKSQIQAHFVNIDHISRRLTKDLTQRMFDIKSET